LTAEIIGDNGLILEDAPKGTIWEKVKIFANGFLNVDKDKGKIQDYTERLTVAMDQFKVSSICHQQH
jgi:hypothetical protein